MNPDKTIQMPIQTKIHCPATALRDVIDYIYISSGHTDSLDFFQVPVMHQELVVNLGDDFAVSALEGEKRNTIHNSWVAGLQCHSQVSTMCGKHLLVGILFKPWGIRQLFDIHPKDLVDNFISPGIHRGIENIVTFIKENKANLFKDLFFCELERHILYHSSISLLKKEILHAVSLRNYAGSEQMGISKLAREYNFSSKSFIASFTDAVGMTPLKYFNLNRVIKAHHMMIEAPNRKLTDIATELGYFDQAHFIKSFRSVFMRSPKEMKKGILR